MLQAFVITLREGLEAFLVVAISLAFSARAIGRSSFLRFTGALWCRLG